MTEMGEDSSGSDLEVAGRLAELVREYRSVGQLDTALYWADKLVTLGQTSVSHPDNVYLLGQCLLASKEFQRAASLVMRDDLHRSHLGCCYIAAQALYSIGDINKSYEIILDGEQQLLPGDGTITGLRRNALVSSLYLLKGQVCEGSENREEATESYKTAVTSDVTCVAAMTALSSHQMLSLEQERQLVTSLQSPGQDVVVSLATHLYWGNIKKYSEVVLAGDQTLSDPEDSRWRRLFEDNGDVKVAELERLYYNCDYHAAFSLSSDILKQDPHHPACLPVHIALLVELNKTSDLFKLAHTLVDLYPEWSVAWFGVGCYYYSTGKQDPARRYLYKATQLDPLFGPAWLAYGHSFAAENEHDQAMAAYFKACQLMKGCHFPLLYIGLEYSHTNNTNLAEKFFNQALEIAPNDPFVLHELGVTAFTSGNLEMAEKYFSDALLRVETVTKSGLTSSLSDKWESLLNNLGHTYRKLGRYSESISFHQQALVLSPLNSSTYSALGYVQSLTGDLASAVQSFHKALGIRREDTFSTNMLTSVIEQLMNSVAPFPGFNDTTPRFPSMVSQSPSSSRECEMEDVSMD